MQEFFETLLDSEKLIHFGGLTLLLIIVFVETGFFFGFFLPGDYLLFTAGLLCGTQDLNVGIETLTLSVMCAAVLGSYTGYFTGRLFGEKILQKKESFFFKKKYMEKTYNFFNKYGKATLILGRYLPIVRTFAPIMAGITKMELKYFSIANISGGILWVGSLIPLGYYFGKNHPEVINYLGYIILGFLILTIAPVLKGIHNAYKIKNA